MNNTLAPSLLLLTAACNTPPEALQVTISPEAPATTDDLVAEVSGAFTDADGDEVTYSFTWYADGVAQDHLTELTVPASETAKHQEWKLFVQPSDGTLEGPPSEAEVTILNTEPTVELSLTPEVPLTTQDVVATVTGHDPDGDELSFGYAWSLDGATTSYQEPTLPADATSRGDVWTLTVTPSDDDEPGEPASATVNIDNTAPVVLSVSLAPAEPREADTIRATVETSDEDGDEVTLDYAWTVDGSVVQQGEADTLTGEHFDKHQQVTVTVTPYDGFIDGEPMQSDPVTVLNSVPSIEAVAIEPAEIYEATEVSCVPAGWSDDDGDDEGYGYSWEVDSVVVGTAATLTGEHFDKGDNVICLATPTDGDDSGETLRSDVATILDSPPEITAATLSTSSPVEGDTLTVAVAASDDDGDAITLSYTWYVDGLPISTNDSLDSTHFDKHQVITVEITPNDGGQDGATFTSATATALNTPPEITALALSPSELYTDDTLTTSVATTDADGDDVTLSYAWTVDGTPISETGASLDGTMWFDKHQTVALVVTPNDGEDDGSTAADSVAALNSPPGAPSLSIAPDVPIELEDDLVCSITEGSIDADGDSVSYTFSWDVDGAAYPGSSTTTEPDDTIPASATTGGELWTCTVSTHDGDEDGSAGAADVLVSIPCDRDSDGYENTECGGDDCDDSDSDVNPDEAEVLGDGVDNDCDGLVDNFPLDDGAIKLTGVSADDHLGAASFAGDLDGDGAEDILVGAWGDNSETGAAYLVRGPITAGMSLAYADATFVADHNLDRFGKTFAGPIDMNCDGQADALIGSEFGYGSSRGAAYVFFGPISTNLHTDDADVTITRGMYKDSLGEHLATGDVNGDGNDDLLLGSPGCCSGSTSSRAYLLLGPVTSDVDVSAADTTFTGVSTTDKIGSAVTMASDLDGDGFSDVATGAIGNDVTDTDAGAVYIFHSPVPSGSVSASGADAVLYGEAADDMAGNSVKGLGDMNGDGYDDLALTAYKEDSAGTDAGALYVVFGPITADASLATAPLKLTGEAAGDSLGSNYENPTGIAAPGDLDADGFDDLVASAGAADGVGVDSGVVYVIMGPASGWSSIADADLRLEGAAAGDYTGWHIASGADGDGDGSNDILISAHGDDTAGTDAGAVYFFSGVWLVHP